CYRKIYALDISGEIPNELFLLKKLKDLNLGQNVLSGKISSAIGQLSDMEYLSLGINNLSGELPTELGNLTKLRSLSFSSNNFNGSLPPHLGNLTSLQQLYIDSSGVSGPIPDELSNLKSLQILWASDNLFTGKLPEFLGSFKDLNVLRLEGTMLEGPIPYSYGSLTKLDDLRIGDLGGEDSSLDFLENLANLTIISLRNSRISGQIPAKLGTFTNLKSLDLSFNKLTGSIPKSFQNLGLLGYLYLGSNNLSGEVPRNIGYTTPLALDVSFNPLSGLIPPFVNTWNSIGTSIAQYRYGRRKEVQLLRCISNGKKCSNNTNPSTSFSIKCGGSEMETLDGNKFKNDSETLGAATVNIGGDHAWAVSNTGAFLSNPQGSKYTTETSSQITQTLNSELYKSARVSPSSLRYYGLGMKNGAYRIKLHFAEIQMDDDPNSWKGLGRRLFDIYIQGKRIEKDFNVRKEAGGSKRALMKVFEANVTNTILDIHFMWAGRGTCCIPFQSTYGPLVSAIHVSQILTNFSTFSPNN
ncbi:probable LRR receptor-like serine/threonine-protein kinase At1g56140, partial [Impatiens glandulifera]|uniref:probable LRR receptor-like serine/threonine-protein kinase At1g56140 n=1 Tax=Impatiens glandulifera TaxID=253017 RepID=UPI001FB09EE2